MHFLFTKGKTDRRIWSSLPGISSLVCCLLKALGFAIFTWPGGSLLEGHWTGLKAALQPLVLLAGGEQAEEIPQLTAASLAAFSDAYGNNRKGQDFQFFLLSSDPNWLWDDWFYVQGQISCQHLICISGDLSPLWHLIESFFLRQLCLFAEEGHLLYSCAHRCGERAGFSHWWVGGSLTISSRWNFSCWLQGVCYGLISACRLEHLFWPYLGPCEEMSDLELPLAPAAAVMAPFSWGIFWGKGQYPMLSPWWFCWWQYEAFRQWVAKKELDAVCPRGLQDSL